MRFENSNIFHINYMNDYNNLYIIEINQID